MKYLIFLLALLPLLLVHGQDARRPVVVGTGNRIRVATMTSAYQPFAKVKASCEGVDPRSNEECRGNGRYEGYCLDLMEAIKQQIPSKPNFEFIGNQDSNHGVRQGNGTFNGLIGQAQRREVDMICAPMAVTEDRARVMEFSQPIMSSGISIMMKRKESEDSCFSLFFRPFTLGTWLLILLTILLLLLARLALLFLKKKLRSAHPPNRQTHHQQQQNVGGHTNNDGHNHSPNPQDDAFYQNQHAKINLVKNIRRILKYLLWAFLSLVLIYYFANLTAHLISRRSQRNAVQSVEELNKQNNLQYGMVRNGATHQYFQQSTDPAHQQLLRSVESQNGFVSNYSEGVQKVRESDGNYAFLLESGANDYASREDCSTFQAGNNLNSLNYAIGMPTGSPWREQINAAIRTLRANGELDNIRNKWWSAAGEACPVGEESHRLGWSDLCALFLLIPLLLLLGLLYAVARHFMDRKKKSRGHSHVDKRYVYKHDQHPHQQRLHSPQVTVKNESTTTEHGHFNDRGDNFGRGDQPHVITHPIHVEEKTTFAGRRN